MEPAAANAAIQFFGQRFIGDALAGAEDMQAGVLRILQKLTERAQGLNIFGRRLARLNHCAGALAARYHAHIAKSAQRLAYGVAADAELLAQFKLGRQHGADRVLSIGDLAQERIRYFLIAQPGFSRFCLAHMVPSGLGGMPLLASRGWEHYKGLTRLLAALSEGHRRQNGGKIQ